MSSHTKTKTNLISLVFSSSVETSLSEATTKPKSNGAKKCDSIAPLKSSSPTESEWKLVATSNKKTPHFTVTNTAKNSKPKHGSAISTKAKENALTSNAFFLPPTEMKPSISQVNHINNKSYRKNRRRALRRAETKMGKKVLIPGLSSCEHTEQTKSKGMGMGMGCSIDVSSWTTTARSPSNLQTESTSVLTINPLPSSECQLMSLPYDIVTNRIFGYLRVEDMAALGSCSRATKEICEDGYLWQILFQKKFPASKLAPASMQEWKRAYQLSLVKLVDQLRCPSTKQTFMEDILGVGVNFTVNPKTKVIDYIDLSHDLISQTAFSAGKRKSDLFGNSFKLFLPLYFSQDHFQRALPTICRCLLELGRSRQIASNGTRFRQVFYPMMVLDIFPKMLTTFIVLLSDQGVTACRKSYQGLTRIHCLFIALAHQYPEIKREALHRIKLFCSNEKYRTKLICPNMGVILPLLMVIDSQDCNWFTICSSYLNESFDRMVLWICKKYPQLEKTHDVKGNVEATDMADERVDLTLKASIVNLRLVMLHVYFLKTLSTGTTQLRANRYDVFFGQPDDDTIDNNNDIDVAVGLKKNSDPIRNQSDHIPNLSQFCHSINNIMMVSTWKKFFSYIGIPCPPNKADMGRRLRRHVVNSRRKKYHRAGMDFSRIQASGTSQILSKGQEFSASTDLKKLVFEDIWTFDDDEKFLDATCLLYNGKLLTATVDFQNLFACDKAVCHSGDEMSINQGTHTIDIDLEKLDMNVTSLVFVLSAYENATLSDITSASISFRNACTDDVLCTYDLDSQDKVSHLTSVIMCRLYRVAAGIHKGKWHVHAIGDANKGDASNYQPIYTAVDKLL